MGCPIHGSVADCRCGYAATHRQAPSAREAALVLGLPVLGLAALLVWSCAGKPPCSPVNTPTALTMADCLARVAVECRGIPLGEPCPFEESCKTKVNTSVDKACK